MISSLVFVLLYYEINLLLRSLSIKSQELNIELLLVIEQKTGLNYYLSILFYVEIRVAEIY